MSTSSPIARCPNAHRRTNSESPSSEFFRSPTGGRTLDIETRNPPNNAAGSTAPTKPNGAVAVATSTAGNVKSTWQTSETPSAESQKGWEEGWGWGW